MEQQPQEVEAPATGDQKSHRARTMLSSSVINASKLSLTMAITLPLGLVTKVMLPRVIGSEGAGLLFFAESFPLFLLGLMPMGIPAYIQKYVPPQHEHAWDIFKTVFLAGAVVGTLLVLGLITFLGFSTYDNLTIRVTAIMACYQGLSIFCNDFLQRFQLAIGRYSYVAKLNIVAKIILVVFIAVAVWLTTKLEVIAGAFLAAQLVIFALLMMTVKKMDLMRGKFEAARLKQILLVGLPFFFGGVLNTMNSSIDSFCLLHLATFRELGYYGAAQRLVGVFLMLVPILGQAFGPNLSQIYAKDRDQYLAFMTNVIRILVLLASPLSMGLVAFGPEIIKVLYGADFQPAWLAVLVSGPLVLMSYLAAFFAVSAVTTTTGRYFPLILGFGAAINFVCDYLLIKAGLATFGPGGGAAGAMIASLVATMVETYLLLRTSGIKILNKTTTYVFLVAMLPLVIFCPFGGSWYHLDFYARILLFSAFIPSYLFMTRLLTVADIAMVRRSITGMIKRG